MRIKDMSSDDGGYPDVGVKLQDESRAAVSADGVLVFRVKLRTAIDKHDATFLKAVQKSRIYAEIQYVSSRVWFLSADGR